METNGTLLLCSGMMFLLLAVLRASPVPVATDVKTRTESRPKQRPNQNALDYMFKLHRSMTDEDGAPLDLETSPTSVWCLLNTGKKYIYIFI